MRLDFIYKNKRNWNGIMDLFFLWIVIICVLICLTIMIIYFIWCGNNRLTVSRFSFHSSKISRPIRILQLSDLHNKQFGKENSLLNKVITEQHPDLIVFTGDLEDRRKSYQKESVLFFTQLSEKVPVYFVYGNQEMTINFRERLTADLRKGGVTVLDGQTVDVKIHNQTLSILGLNDYKIGQGDCFALYRSRKLINYFQQTSKFKLLLTHYPQNFDYYNKDYQYSDYKIDLILAGHAHGGLIRLPFLKGLFAPEQGFFPMYTSGLYQKNDVSMIVSRGLGNSGFPFRINNPPDVVVVTLFPQ